jgi:hypothetical protein
MDNTVTAVALLITGGMLGYLSSLGVARTQHRQALTLRVADEYFAARRELVTLIGELADLKLLEAESRASWPHKADEVGSLFYQNFDLLPPAVLDRLILLHVALRNPSNGPYALVERTVIPMTPSEIAVFVRRCTIFENSMYIAPLALHSASTTIRANQVVKLHARDVLYALAECGAIEQLTKLADRVKNANHTR